MSFIEEATYNVHIDELFYEQQYSKDEIYIYMFWKC